MSKILIKNCFASIAYRILLSTELEIIAKIVWILNNLSKCIQFNDYGFGSYYRYENILFEFFDFVALATRPDLFILDIPLPDFDLLEDNPFFYVFFLFIFDDFMDDFIDLDVWDFLPRVLLLNTVPLSY